MNSRSTLRGSILPVLGLILMMVSLYLVFIFVPGDKNSGAIQRIFYFHVPLAWVSFLAFFVTFVCSILYLSKRHLKWDTLAHASAETGLLFTTLVLITGPIWAKPAWGVWWTWDARLTTSLVLWLIYVAYLLVRSYVTEPERGARFSAVIGIIGFIDVPVVFLTVNLWRTQHPSALIFEGGLTGEMIFALMVCIVTFTVLYVLLTSQNASLKVMEAGIRRIRARLDE